MALLNSECMTSNKRNEWAMRHNFLYDARKPNSPAFGMPAWRIVYNSDKTFTEADFSDFESQQDAYYHLVDKRKPLKQGRDWSGAMTLLGYAYGEWK